MKDHNVAIVQSSDDESVSIQMEYLRFYDSPPELNIKVVDLGASMATFGNFTKENIEELIQHLGKFLYIMQKETEK